MVQFSITVDADTLATIDENRKMEGISRSKWINRTISAYLNDQPNTNDEQLIVINEQLKEEISYYRGIIHELTRKIPDQKVLAEPQPGIFHRMRCAIFGQ